MAAQVINDLVAAVAAEDTVVDSAIALLNGIADRVAAAIATALTNGATAAELAPLNDVVTDVRNKTQALTDAVVANTPAAP